MTIPLDFLRSPQDFRGMLAALQKDTASWPPSRADLENIAYGCAALIASIDAWESETRGQDVIDTARGEISTADARRLLALEVAVGDEGDIAVLLVPAGERRVRVELRAFVDPSDDAKMLRRPELVLDWDQDGEDRQHYVSLKRKGAQWYMLAQLRDDLREGRLALS